MSRTDCMRKESNFNKKKTKNEKMLLNKYDFTIQSIKVERVSSFGYNW